jgi:hypothetical protein
MAELSEILELLRFELKFLEDGGYGRSPRTPWRPTFILEDSPSCLNFDDASRPHPCHECFLMQFVPRERQKEGTPCRHIPLTAKGETIDDLYRSGSQIELEDALRGWLHKEINRLEAQQPAAIGRSTP